MYSIIGIFLLLPKMALCIYINMTTQVGSHVIINAYNIPNDSLLQSLDAGILISREIVNSLDLHVIGEVTYQFQPYGYTLLYLLSESHYSIHTYPEYHSCYIDIFCCNKEFNTLKAVQLVKILFLTNDVEYQIMLR